MLSISEKGYFKRFTSNHIIGEKNDYIRLFEVINEQTHPNSIGEGYNEDIIKKQFSGKSFIKRLPAVKGYLYDQILSSMDRYHSNRSIDSQIKELLNSAKLRKRLEHS